MDPAAAERDEKLRLARKKLGKFQKNKKKTDPVAGASDGGSGAVTPLMAAEDVPGPGLVAPVVKDVPGPKFKVPVPVPIVTASTEPYEADAPGPRGYRNAPTTKPISPSVYTQPPPTTTQDSQRRSIFNSFVSAMTNTFNNPDQDSQLDDARKLLQTAREERRSRASSRAASPVAGIANRQSSHSPQPPPPAVSGSTVGVSNVLGMASRLFSSAGGIRTASPSTPARDSRQQQSYSSAQNNYQYGVQEGRDFSNSYYSQQNLDHSQHQPVGEYQYGQQQHYDQQQFEHSQQTYDQNGYQYGAQENAQYGDPQMDYTQQQHQQQQQYDNHYQYDHNQLYSGQVDANGIPYYGDQQQQQYYYDQSYAPKVSHYAQDSYNQQSYNNQPIPSAESTDSYPQPAAVHDSNPFGSAANNLPWDPIHSTSSSHDAIPGFGAPHAHASPFDGLGRLSRRSSQEFHSHETNHNNNNNNNNNLFAQESIPFGDNTPASHGSSSDANLFRQEPVVNRFGGRTHYEQNPFPPIAAALASPARGRSPSVRSRRSLSRAAAPSPQSPFSEQPQQAVAASPIPFASNISYSSGHEFPIGGSGTGSSGGLQTWPTSPTQIQNASLSRRTSANPLSHTATAAAALASHSRHSSAVFNTGNDGHHNNYTFHPPASPILEQSTPAPKPPSRPASTSVPPIDTALYHHQQEEEDQYFALQQQQQQVQEQAEYNASLSPTTHQYQQQQYQQQQQKDMIEIPTGTYNTLLQENDALTRQLAAQEQHLNSAISTRLTFQQKCTDLETEREGVLASMQQLKQVVQGFGDLNERTSRVEELEALLADREARLEDQKDSVQEWEERVSRREQEVLEREGEMITTGNDELDVRMRVRIQEIEASRAEVEALKAGVKKREVEVEKELREAIELKHDSGEALKRVEASLLKLQEREEEAKRGAVALDESQDQVRELHAAVEAKIAALDARETALKAQEEEFLNRKQQFEYEWTQFENDKAVLINNFRNNELEEARLAEQRHGLETLADRLREDQESLRNREAEIRAREDEFLSEATNLANREAVQLAELRKNYDADVERFQLDSADLERREAQLNANSDDLYRLSQEVNDEKTRVEQMKRKVEHDRNELNKQAAEIQEAQANLASQQAALDEAVASFSEMKEYIDNSMKENEARIRAEFESLQEAHADLKQREEVAMQDIQNERLMVEELQRSIENEREESLRYGANAVATAELDDKIALLEKDNSDLREFVNELSAARSQAANQIDELEESNRQLQSNVLRLTQMIESGSIKKSSSLRSVIPSSEESRTAVDERVELLEKKYEEISKEESTLKEAAAALVTTANDLKKIWSDAVPALEELKLRREETPNADRSHMWTGRRGDTDVASSTRSLSDADLFGNNKDLFNVIVSLTSTNQNLSKKLDETLNQVQTLQQQKSSKRSTQAKNSHDSLHVYHSSRKGSFGVSEVAETVSSTGVTGFNSAHASSLPDYDNMSNSAATSISQQDGGNGYFASNETMSSYGTATSATHRYTQKPVYPSARSMTKVPNGSTTVAAATTSSILRRPFGSVDYTDSVSEYSETASDIIKPTNARIPFTTTATGSSGTPTSLPMARISSNNHKGVDSDNDSSSDSVHTPRVGGAASSSVKRSTAPANYYSSARKAEGTGVTSALSSRYNNRSQTVNDTARYHHYTEPEQEASSRNVSRHVSLEGLRSYFTDKDLEAFSEPAQKVMFGSSSSNVGGRPVSAGRVEESTSSLGVGKYGRRDRDVTFSSGVKAKSDTEGVTGWGQSRGGSATGPLGLRTVSSTGNRTESIRDAIRERIKKRDLGEM
ncbi:UNVERIFIED_CONTAM: hypothetical protein HDU68_001136 [Siphonaria sp. JEL0065]|nr:hypothetical protein HDU68_001136 [Siphonaria sp. JEL0065]